jgi:5-methylcytosine-specific restriction endonuclease McrA
LSKLRTICPVPGCPRFAEPFGRCDVHGQRMSARPWARRVRAVLRRDRGVCWLCGQAGADTADHVVMWVDGGSDELENLRAAHQLCNLRRSVERQQRPHTGAHKRSARANLLRVP